jgi:hypothetical protein
VLLVLSLVCWCQWFNHGRWPPLQPIDVHISSEAQPAEGSTLALALVSEYNVSCLWCSRTSCSHLLPDFVARFRGAWSQSFQDRCAAGLLQSLYAAAISQRATDQFPQRGSRNQGQIASRAVFRVVGSAEEAMAQLDSSAPLVDEADDFDVEVGCVSLTAIGCH